MKMKRTLAILTALMMILGLFPLQALAEEGWGDYLITEADLKPGSELPDELNNETLDLNEYDLDDLTAIKIIPVEGDSTVIGTGSDKAIEGIRFLLKDGAALTIDSYYGKISGILVDDGASASLRTAGETCTLRGFMGSSSQGIPKFDAIEIGANGTLRISGETTLSLPGNVVGEGSLELENANVTMGPTKSFDVCSMAIVNSTIAQSKTISAKDAPIVITDSQVKTSTFVGNLELNGSSKAETDKYGCVNGNVVLNGGTLLSNGVNGTVTVNGGSMRNA